MVYTKSCRRETMKKKNKLNGSDFFKMYNEKEWKTLQKLFGV
jgi:hypothetical protein